MSEPMTSKQIEALYGPPWHGDDNPATYWEERCKLAERQRDELLALVEKAEWTPQCPWCKGYDLGGHRDDCERESTLGSVRGSQ